MKTAEEKAKELVRKFWLQGIEIPDSKKCALICVEEIIKNNPHEIIERFYVDSGGNKTDEKYFDMVSNEFYWQEVKQKINEL